MIRGKSTCRALQQFAMPAVNEGGGGLGPGCLTKRPDAASHDLWHAVVDQCDEGLIVFDPAGRALAMNRSAAVHLGRAAAAVVGRSCRQICDDLFPTPDGAAHAECFADAVARGLRGEAADQEIDLPLAGGGCRRLELAARPLTAGAAGPALAVLKIQPRTGFDPGYLQRCLIDSMAHEFRTPLTAISGFLDLLQQSGDQLGAERRREFLRIIRENVDDLRTLVENAIRSADQGGVGGRGERVNLTPVVAEALEDLRSGIRERRLTLRLDVPPVLGPVAGDRERLREMTRQVIRAAIRRSETQGSLHVRGYPQAGCVMIEIRNDGPTVPAAQRLIFQSGAIPDAMVKSGGGLWLSVAKKIAVQHRGAISVQSREGAVTIRLPLEGQPDALCEEGSGG